MRSWGQVPHPVRGGAGPGAGVARPWRYPRRNQNKTSFSFWTLFKMSMVFSNQPRPRFLISLLCCAWHVPWRAAVFPHSNCWHLRVRVPSWSSVSHLSVGIEHICIVQTLCWGTRNVMVSKTQSLTWTVYTGCRGKKNKQALTAHRGPCLDEHRLGSMAVGRGSTDLALGMWIGGWRGCSREVSSGSCSKLASEKAIN